MNLSYSTDISAEFKKKKEIAYIVINRSLGELDWIMPLIAVLKNNERKVIIIFMHYCIYKTAKKEWSGLFSLLEKYSSEIYHPASALLCMSFKDRFIHKNTTYNRIYNKKGNSWLAWWVAWKVFFFPLFGKLNHFKIGLLAELVVKYYISTFNIKGSVFIDTTFITDANWKRGAYWNLVEKLVSDSIFIYPHGVIIDSNSKLIIKHERENWERLARIPIDAKKIYLSGTKHLCEKVDENTNCQCLYVGVPRYQNLWRKVIDNTYNISFAEKSEFPTILFIVKGVSTNITTLLPIQDEIIDCLKSSGYCVLIKPHPRMGVSIVRGWLKLLGKQGALVTDPLTVAALRCDAVFSLPSTACMDAVAVGKPVFEFYNGFDIAEMLQSSVAKSQSTLFAQEGLVYPLSSISNTKDILSQIVIDKSFLTSLARKQEIEFNRIIDRNIGLEKLFSAN